VTGFTYSALILAASAVAAAALVRASRRDLPAGGAVLG
jgi:hypothetical protein